MLASGGWVVVPATFHSHFMVKLKSLPMTPLSFVQNPFRSACSKLRQNEGSYKKIDNISFEVYGTRSVFHLLILIEVLRKRPQFSGQFRQNLDFSEFLKKWKMANFKSKNLCDKSLKIKNLRWQFSCIFRWLRRGVLRFFCRCRYHGDICRSKSPVLQISE